MHPCQSDGRVCALQARGPNFGKTSPTPVRKGGALHHGHLDLNPTGDSRWQLIVGIVGLECSLPITQRVLTWLTIRFFSGSLLLSILINWISAFLTGRSQAVKLETLCLIGSHPGEVSRKGRNWVWFCLLWWPTISCVTGIWGLNSLMIPRH